MPRIDFDIRGFDNSCPHYELINGRVCCKYMSNVIGHDILSSPQECAHCIMKGRPDESLLNRNIETMFMSAIHHIRIGLVMDQNKSEIIFNNAFDYFKNNKSMMESVKSVLKEAVEYGKFGYERAERLTIKHGLE